MMKHWVPITKLGRENCEEMHKIFFLQQINKEVAMIESLFINSQKKVILIRNQKRSKNKKIFIYIGNKNGYLGYSLKSSKNLQFAMIDGSRVASLSICPIQRSPFIYEKKIFFTIPNKLLAKRGSLRIIIKPKFQTCNRKVLVHLTDILKSIGCSKFYISGYGKSKAKLNQILIFLDILQD